MLELSSLLFCSLVSPRLCWLSLSLRILTYMMVLLFSFSRFHFGTTKKICAHCQIKRLFSLWKVTTFVSSILRWSYSVGILMTRSVPFYVMYCTRFTVCVRWMPSNSHHFVEQVGVLLPVSICFLQAALTGNCMPDYMLAAVSSHQKMILFPAYQMKASFLEKITKYRKWKRRTEITAPAVFSILNGKAASWRILL